jgi:hypothetical protein
MYCPLCKAEYRQGFNRCSDCLTELVHTSEEAEAVSVKLLWKGASLSKFDEIVATLRDANIPNHSRSSANSESAPVLFRASVRSAVELTKQMGWQVFVLETDYSKALATIENLP